MPREGIDWMEKSEILSFEEIVRIARVAVEHGVRKIRVTGGEPLVRRDILHLFQKLGALPGLETLAVTTNGVYLKEMAGDLQRAGVSIVNISLDTLRRDRFFTLTYRDEFQSTLDGLHAALAAGFKKVKLNTVVMRGVNDDEVMDLVEFVRDKPINIRFIEFMPFAGNDWNADTLVPYRELISKLEERYVLKPMSPTDVAQTAKDFSIEGFLGTVSFITSMTESFCSSCDRLRITADGYFKPCLFSHKEISIRDVLRSGGSDEDIANVFFKGLLTKAKDHVEARAIEMPDRAMIQIGG